MHKAMNAPIHHRRRMAHVANTPRNRPVQNGVRASSPAATFELAAVLEHFTRLEIFPLLRAVTPALRAQMDSMAGTAVKENISPNNTPTPVKMPKARTGAR